MSKARVLIYDIETAPNLGYTWGKWEQNVIAFEKQWYIMCFAYKWLGDRTTKVISLPDFPLYQKDPENDLEVVKKLKELFDEAEVIIAHNGDSFDQKKVQARFMVHKLGPPTPYRQIDTKKIARKYANFNSNSLNELGKTLGLGEKVQTGGFSLWQGCIAGNAAAWRTMKRYNKQDVDLLEKIYLELRPWIANHPAMNLLNENFEACPKCGENKGFLKNGSYANKVTKVQIWKCKNCLGFIRSRMVDATKEHVQFVS